MKEHRNYHIFSPPQSHFITFPCLLCHFDNSMILYLPEQMLLCPLFGFNWGMALMFISHANLCFVSLNCNFHADVCARMRCPSTSVAIMKVACPGLNRRCHDNIYDLFRNRPSMSTIAPVIIQNCLL